MVEYNKINTIYKRDINNIIMPYSGFVLPEIEWMENCLFEATEKVDGTNIGIHLVPIVKDIVVVGGIDDYIERTVTYHIEYHGRTERAQIPTELLKFLMEKYPLEKMLAAFNLKERQVLKLDNNDDIKKTFPTYIVWGEGHGRGIQKGGGRYISKGVSFRVFDVQVGDWYLLRDSMLDVAKKLDAPTVHYYGLMTVQEAIDMVKAGFTSPIAEDTTYPAEGLVLKSPHGIRLRNGQRLIFKIKTCDWAKYFNKYGTFEPVEQVENPKFKPEE